MLDEYTLNEEYEQDDFSYLDIPANDDYDIEGKENGKD